MTHEDVRRAEILNFQKRELRFKAEKKRESAQEKLDSGDFGGAKLALMDARQLIQQALRKVQQLGERGISERSIQDNIEDLWRKIIEKEREK